MMQPLGGYGLLQTGKCSDKGLYKEQCGKFLGVPDLWETSWYLDLHNSSSLPLAILSSVWDLGITDLKCTASF